MKQQNLFPDFTPASNGEKKLVISKFKNKILSKEQTAFNKHSKKIETLREQIESDQLKYNKLSSYYLTKVQPEHEKYARASIDFVKQLYHMHKYEKLTNVAKEKLGLLILNNLEHAFEYIIPNDDEKAIYDTFSDISYNEQEKEQLEMLKNSMGEMFSEMFDTDIDFSDMDMSEEGIAKKMAELKDEIVNNENNNPKLKNRKQTKKEIEAKIRKKQAEELQNKSIRSIYTSLAKMLHPDLETDEIKKLEKQELMKKITNAYHEKDLHTLLKFELEIIHQESENIEHLTDEKLRLLNLALKEQVIELEHEKNMQRQNPKYEKIVSYGFYSEKTAIQQMDVEIKEITAQQKEIYKDLELLKQKKGLQFLNQILKNIQLNNSLNSPFDDTDMNMDDMLAVFELIGNMAKVKRKK